MLNTMSQQQQQQNATKNKKKKKKFTKKVDGAEEQGLVGGGDAIIMKEKKPLHTSMEQLQVVSENQYPLSGRLPNISRRAAGANWNAQLSNLNNTCHINRLVDVTNGNNSATPEATETTTSTLSKSARLRQKRKAAQRNKYVAMDCEMVGTGYNGQDDMLARVSIVNKRGDVLLDEFVKPRETVTDYRTSVSGIRPHDIEHGEDFHMVQDKVVQLIQGKILVGHAIRNDLAVLHIKHPYVNIRDTARYKPLCRLVSNGRTPSLKRLSQAILGVEIQTGEHNSVEDARAAMNIYNRLSGDWEKYLQKHPHKQGK